MLRTIRLSTKIIFFFNWARYFNTSKFYKEYPYLTEDAANFLIKAGIQLIGMDTPSPDDSRTKIGSPEDSKIHKILLKNNVILIEYLNIPKLDIFSGWNLVALPLKIKSCDGSPARIFIYRD
jgi:arylformamidase